jgi:hypothetical protein
MMGEELNATEVTQHGLLGDRAYALVDQITGKIASAKNPRKWPTLFDFRATFMEPPLDEERIPPVRITLPNGVVVTSDGEDVNQVLSSELGREVALQKKAPDSPSLEEYWPDIDGLANRETVTDEATLAGTFFDGAVIHLLTTATIDHLRELYPQGRFEVRRFRPNIVVALSGSERGFVESDWVGRTLAIGDTVRIKITRPCSRCVMTILPQGDLPKDSGIFRTAVQHNQANVGIYGTVLQDGTIRRGDPINVELESS